LGIRRLGRCLRFRGSPGRHRLGPACLRSCGREAGGLNIMLRSAPVLHRGAVHSSFSWVSALPSGSLSERQRDNLHGVPSLVTEFPAVPSMRGLLCPGHSRTDPHANTWPFPTSRQSPFWPKDSPDEIRAADRVQTLESNFVGCLSECPLSESTIWHGNDCLGRKAERRATGP
jgi:hypothetical protein